MDASRSRPRESRNRAQPIVGVALGVVSLAVLVGGVLLLSVADDREVDGFYATRTHTLASPTHALVSERLDLGTDGPDWMFRKGRLGTIRVTAEGMTGKPTFIGVARAPQVHAYLRGVAMDKVVDLDVDPFSVTYTRQPGSAEPGRPVAQTFWAKTSTGSGKQTLTWQVQKGAWAVVVMNADASAGVRADVTIGAKVPILHGAAVAVVSFGSVLAVLAGAVLYTGLRRRVRRPQSAGIRAGLGGAP